MKHVFNTFIGKCYLIFHLKNIQKLRDLLRLACEIDIFIYPKLSKYRIIITYLSEKYTYNWGLSGTNKQC